VINLANEVFGFDGWSTEIRSLHTDYVRTVILLQARAHADRQLDVTDAGRCSVCVTAHIRITLRDGTYHEDIGCGSGENIKGKGSALEKVCGFIPRLRSLLSLHELTMSRQRRKP
jgi:DNA repair and recombination protein RAD52